MKKRGKIITFLIAIIMIIANVTTVFAAWGDAGYTVKADGRWYQWFGFTAGANEKYSTDNYQPVQKLYTARDAAIQLTAVKNSAYPVACTVYTYGACAIPDSVTVVFSGVDAQAAPYYGGVLANYKCLGYVTNSRRGSNYIEGLWSPDSYK